MATYVCGECSGGVPRAAAFCPKCGSALEWSKELVRGGYWLSRLIWAAAILGAVAAGVALTCQIRKSYEFSWEHPATVRAANALAPVPLVKNPPVPQSQPARVDREREQRERLADEARARALAVDHEEAAAKAERAEAVQRDRAAAREAYQDCMNKLHTHDVLLQDVASVALGARRIEIGAYIVQLKLLQRSLEAGLDCRLTSFREPFSYQVKAEGLVIDRLSAWRDGADDAQLDWESMKVDSAYYQRLEKDSLTRIRWSVGIFP